MFRSIQYQLYLFTLLLIIAVAGGTASFFLEQYVYVVVAGVILLICLLGLNRVYQRYNQNILFLLNALENGDYSFYFSEKELSPREKELNMMLNRIREILTAARKEVIANEKFLSLIVESVSTGILIVNDRGVVKTRNQAALSMLGLPVFTHINQLAVIDETFPELFHKLKAGDRKQLTLLNEREEQSIALQVSQIKIQEKRFRIISLNNIGNELENKELESWIRLIRVMTHEIMNAIAPITSLSETMATVLRATPDQDLKQLKSNMEESFETISTTAKGLLSFVESYRKFTSLPTPKKQTLKLYPLLENVVKLHESALQEKGIEAVIEADDLSLTGEADSQLLMQVLVNLVKNAVEAIDHPEGKIRIRLALLPDKRICIAVGNNGTPIPQEVLPHIFIPFFTTKSAGSGIGLSVSRYIMRLHGGKLQHALTSNGWTEFYVSF